MGSGILLIVLQKYGLLNMNTPFLIIPGFQLQSAKTATENFESFLAYIQYNGTDFRNMLDSLVQQSFVFSPKDYNYTDMEYKCKEKRLEMKTVEISLSKFNST